MWRSLEDPGDNISRAFQVLEVVKHEQLSSGGEEGQELGLDVLVTRKGNTE
jgi:hypothetical protein